MSGRYLPGDAAAARRPGDGSVDNKVAHPAAGTDVGKETTAVARAVNGGGQTMALSVEGTLEVLSAHTNNDVVGEGDFDVGR